MRSRERRTGCRSRRSRLGDSLKGRESHEDDRPQSVLSFVFANLTRLCEAKLSVAISVKYWDGTTEERERTHVTLLRVDDSRTQRSQRPKPDFEGSHLVGIGDRVEQVGNPIVHSSSSIILCDRCTGNASGYESDRGLT